MPSQNEAISGRAYIDSAAALSVVSSITLISFYFAFPKEWAVKPYGSVSRRR